MAGLERGKTRAASRQLQHWRVEVGHDTVAYRACPMADTWNQGGGGCRMAAFQSVLEDPDGAGSLAVVAFPWVCAVGPDAAGSQGSVVAMALAPCTRQSFFLPEQMRPLPPSDYC